MGEPFFIVIMGLIGAGKSTLAKNLGEVLDLPVYYESVGDNDMLAEFYANMKETAFTFQVHNHSKRTRMQQQIVWASKGGVLDRSIEEDDIFAEMLTKAGNMTPRELKTYRALVATAAHTMAKPTVYVYLDVSPETALTRIKERGRDCEAGIDLPYLCALRDGYEEFLTRKHAAPVIRVPWEQFGDAADVAKRILATYEAIPRIHNLA